MVSQASQNQRAGTQMAAIMNHENPKHKPTRDHSKGNVQSMRQLQEKIREKKLEDAQKKAGEENQWKMKQFENVQPRYRDYERMIEERDVKREELRFEREAQKTRNLDTQKASRDGRSWESDDEQ